MERIYNKLVRDKIPEIIRTNGENPMTRKLKIAEYKTALESKLREECEEVIAANGPDRIEELADLLEVARSLAKIENKSLDDVLAVAEIKRTKRGGFDDHIFLEKVVE